MKKINIVILLLCMVAFTSCNNFLDREPLDKITPEVYFKSTSDLEAYTISHYYFPRHGGWGAGTFTNDNNTDNQSAVNPSGIWVPGEWRVGASGGSWSFWNIRELNYFIQTVKSNYEKKLISGSDAEINHFLGEAYFLRAYEYFNKLQALGDFPIIRNTLPDNKDALINASKRQPRNKVARFIISDLDSAIMLMKDNPVSNKNRLSKQVAQLLKSRVALFEGTWLKYHKGTAFVPGGPGWPGASYNTGFSIDIDGEIDYFLGEAMSSAKAIADAVPLVESNGVVKGNGIFSNPYFKMFGDLDMSGYSEVLLWKDYDAGMGSIHYTVNYLSYGGAATGYTKNFVETFLMEDGKPIYASGIEYKDDSVSEVRANRDHRLQLFMSANGDTLIYDPKNVITAKYPTLLEKDEHRSVTGYVVKKGLYGGNASFTNTNPTETGCIIFRATEAYLNYIEAVYEKMGSIDGVADGYWKQLRKRAGLPEDYNITIGATDLSQEKDWAKYSGTSLVDPTLYNIRRERRCEFIAEGMRMRDLKRWRALDQVQDYIIEGFKIWGPMHEKYVKDGKTLFRARPDADPNVSPKSASLYLRPYQIVEANNKFFNGYRWTQAHYLSPIAYEHFLLASKDGDVSSSVIYQNPNWPVQANGVPTE